MASTVWRGHLTFGLISIPIRLFRAARAERISLRKVVRSSALPESRSASCQHPIAAMQDTPTVDVGAEPDPLVSIRQSSRSEQSGIQIPESAVTRAVEVRKSQFVEIPPDELKKLRVSTSTDMAIQEFVSLDQIDPLYFETSYYVIPEEVGERAYALLYQALVKTSVVALAELSMHGRDHVVVIRPGQTGLVAHTMFYVSEVHLDEQFRADIAGVAANELKLAQALVTSLTSTFAPEKYRNGYHQRLQTLVENRVNAAQVEQPRAEPKAGAAVVDIADALRKSLAQLKKPAQKSTKAEPARHSGVRVKKAAQSGT